MAISQAHHMFLIFGSLFFLPVLRAVDFEYCNKSGYEFGNVSRVEISPNPIGPEDFELTITLFGYAKKSIKEGLVEVHAKSENITDLLRRSDMCDGSSNCSIQAFSNFVLPLTEVVKDVLEGEYKYEVTLFDKDVVGEPIVIMCVDFGLPTSSFVSASLVSAS
ncbi:unnamed protein product [Cochlearia groenlandica]